MEEFTCPGCSGQLVRTVISGLFKCDTCGGLFTIHDGAVRPAVPSETIDTAAAFILKKPPEPAGTPDDRGADEKAAAVVIAVSMQKLGGGETGSAVMATRLLGHGNAAVAEAVRAGLFKYLERWWRSDLDKLNAFMNEVKSRNADVPEAVQFADISLQAHAHVMDAVYDKMLRNLTQSYLTDGTVARCPKCGSTNVKSEPAHIEFTKMTCLDCGEWDLCDDWQLEDWYPPS